MAYIPYGYKIQDGVVTVDEKAAGQVKVFFEKYISGLSYVNYNVLVTNWNSSNVKDILMPCMYEDIYRISTGENLKTEDWKIPAEEYERIMTTYFPVSIEQLRESIVGMMKGVTAMNMR